MPGINRACIGSSVLPFADAAAASVPQQDVEQCAGNVQTDDDNGPCPFLTRAQRLILIDQHECVNDEGNTGGYNQPDNPCE